jgi:hypothetical protein
LKSRGGKRCGSFALGGEYFCGRSIRSSNALDGCFVALMQPLNLADWLKICGAIATLANNIT